MKIVNFSTKSFSSILLIIKIMKFRLAHGIAVLALLFLFSDVVLSGRSAGGGECLRHRQCLKKDKSEPFCVRG